MYMQKNKIMRFVWVLAIIMSVLGVFSVPHLASAQSAEEQCNSFLDQGDMDAYNACYDQVINSGAHTESNSEGGSGGDNGSSDGSSWTSGPDKTDCSADTINQDNCGIVRYIALFINVLSGLAGIVIVGSIVYGGIQYSMAGSDAQKVSAAKARIRNANIALLFFLFGYAFLNYIVPGGVL